MGPRHTKEELLSGALDTAFEVGLSQLTFANVANHLEINDRTIVYYFPSKDDLVTEVLISLGQQLQETLTPAFAQPAADYLSLMTQAWPMLSRKSADPVFALFFEASGLAAAGHAPYCDIVPQLMEAWIAWAATFVEGTAKQRRLEAETAVALLDGLLLMRNLVGPQAAARAAKRLGIR
jgi:AcrR family transcriptional regulator